MSGVDYCRQIYEILDVIGVGEGCSGLKSFRKYIYLFLKTAYACYIGWSYVNSPGYNDHPPVLHALQYIYML